MYKIIGADGKEYGPITADQLRRWIAEGRVNAHTRARAADAQDWKALYQFPEFADAPGAPAAAAPPPTLAGSGSGENREAAVRIVRGPAIALMVASILNLVVGIFLLTHLHAIEEFYAGRPEFKDPQMRQSLHLLFGPMGFGGLSIGMLISLVILFAAIKMNGLKHYAFAFTASILAMIPCATPCCLVGLPFGIWAVAALSRSEVKSQFR